MTKRMLIDALHPEEARVVITDNNKIQEFDFVTTAKKQIKGNIYLAKITRVEPSLQAAFVEYGGGKQGFLPFAEIHPDYYQIPIADRKRLIEEAEQAAEEEERAEEETTTDVAFPSDPAFSADTTSSADAAFPADGAAAQPVANTEEVTILKPDAGEIPADVVQAFPSFLEESISAGTVEDPAAPVAEEATAYQPTQASEPVAYSEPLTPAAEGITTTTAEELETPFPPDAAAPADAAAPVAEEVDTIADEEAERPRRRASFHRRYKIQEVIKRNQIVLVQVIKEERGNKGVSLTTYISLAGRYCVLMPNSPKDGGISRKIASGEDRRRLKQLSAELRLSAGMSAIIRTAGIDRSQEEIRRDFDYLVSLWNTIREKTLASTAPAAVHEEGDIVKRSIRDMYNNDIDEIIVEGKTAFESAKEFMKVILPSHAPKVKEHAENVPLFYSYDVEEQMLSMHDPVVRLRSGGYIVVGVTEALIAIDVNSGRATGERNIEETAAKTNLEAAAEIARQVRLRDLAGLIVIDFIDMMDGRNRRNVERALRDALKRDRAKIQIGRISAFGLLEMSRQRLRPSVSETNMTTCPHCQGRGVVRSNDSIAIQIVRALEKDASAGAFTELRLVTSSGVAAHLFNTRRHTITSLEQQYNIRVLVVVDENLPPAGFRIEKNKKNSSQQGADNDNQGKRRRDRDRDRDRNRNRDEQEAQNNDVAEVAVSENSPEATEGEPAGFEEQGGRRGRRNRGRRGGKRFREDGAPPQAQQVEGTSDISVTSEPQAEGAAPQEGADQQRGGRRRNRRDRGRRHWRDRDNRNTPEHTTEGSAAVVAPVITKDSSAPAAQEFSFNAKPEGQEFIFNQPSPPAQSGNDAPASPPRKGWWRRIVE